jgi:hypothetical protein
VPNACSPHARTSATCTAVRMGTPDCWPGTV